MPLLSLCPGRSRRWPQHNLGGLHPNLGVLLVVGGPAGLGGMRLVWGGLMLPEGAKPAPRASPQCRGRG